MKTLLKYALLCITVILGIFLVYQPHIANPLPLLGDEYVHISLAKQLLDEGTAPFTNPYIATVTPHTNYEFGFHYFLVFLFAITPGDSIVFYKYFASVFFVINGLLLFYLVKSWSKSYTISLFALLFFATIKSTSGLLTHQYFVPLTIGTTLLLVSHIFLYGFFIKHEARYLVMLGVSILLTAITYPPAFFFFITTAIIYLFSADHDLAAYFNTTEQKFVYSLSFVTLVMTGLFLGVLTKFHLFEKIIFDTSWSALQANLSPIFYFGIVPSALALFGIWQIMHTKITSARMVVYWFLFSLTAIYLFYIFGNSILIPFPRLFFFYLISVSILAGYGAKTVLTFSLNRSLRLTRVFCIILFCIILSIHVIDAVFSHTTVAPILDNDGYKTLTNFNRQYPDNAVIIADPLTSIAVYPIAGNHVLNVLNTNIGGGDSTAVRLFLKASCEDKKKMFENFTPYLQNNEVQNAPFFILSKSVQDCDFLTLLPESTPSMLLYRLDKGTLSQFQHELLVELLPSPSDLNVVILPGTLDNDLSITNLISGNTIESTTWIDYYNPDGTLQGLSKGSYSGVWKVEGALLCFYFPADAVSECRSVRKNGDKIELYTIDGLHRIEGDWREGNPFNL